jgi:hypothetical protein
VTFNWMPTSSRLIVVNGFEVPSPVEDELPVMNGTFSPTMIFASWLSSVRTLGVESRLTLAFDASACT